MNIFLDKKLSESDLTIFLFFKEDRLASRLKPYFDTKTLTLLLSDFKNDQGETRFAYSELGRVMLLGLGNKKTLNPSSFRKTIQSGLLAARSFDIKRTEMLMPAFPNPAQYLEILGLSAVFANYDFSYYKQAKNKTELTQITIVSNQASNALRQALERGRVIGEAINESRNLANHPANIATPKHLAHHAIEIGKKYGIKTKVLDENQIKKEKLGLLMGVSAGSDEPPRFIVMDYGPANLDPIVLIGKGLTFDSGGVSIKPADKMDEMKYDMCGASTVLGVMEAASRLKLKQRLVALIPSSENLLSGRAVKPGDVLYSHNGTTVEVINTDAEGRLILADAISYAKKYYKPKAIIDYATLTGAVIIALGDEYAGAFTNSTKLGSAATYAASVSGEKINLLPLAPEYKDHLKSNIADIRNIGDKGFAGAITAALFLERFVDKIPWLHLDIAGTAWTMRPRSYMPAGATGWGVYFTLAQLSKLG